jgi:glycosyltransferase involved in cell wall biosynthesis
VTRRVLLLAWAPFFSGAERALVLTVQQFDKARYIPHVLVGTNGDTLTALRDAGVSCDVVPLVHLDRRRPLDWLRSVWQVVSAARRIGAALIHANDVPSHQPGGYAAKLLGIPAITHVRFPDRHEGFSWFLRSGFDRALFVSEYLRADALAASPQMFAGKSDVLYDGVAAPPMPSDEQRTALRRSLGLPDHDVVVALTGQVAEVKGIWDFVDAAGVLCKNTHAVRFVVLGDDLKGQGALRRAMEERVAARGLSDRFAFLGFRPDAPRLIPAFDIVAVPSHVEPLGNATLEAMAAGRPVVGSRVGGIPEMIVDGETGLLVPPKDPPSLARGIERLVASPELRRAFGLAARLRAESDFGLSLHGSRLQAIYDAVLTGKGGRYASAPR